MSDEPITIESIRRLDIHEGDTIVLTLAEPMTLEQASHIRDQWNELFAHLHVKAIVLERGMDVSIVGESEPPAPKPVRGADHFH